MSDAALEVAALRVCPDRCRVPCRTCARKASEAVTAYLAAREAEGFVMVPVEPTEAQEAAGMDAYANDETTDGIYRAMIAAAKEQANAGT